MVANRIDFEEWVAVGKVWTENPNWVEAPRWVRVVVLALSRVQPNGHAPFKKGELAELLHRDGVVPSQQTVHSAIRRGIETGLLESGSIARCLIPTGVQQRRTGNFGECPRKHSR